MKTILSHALCATLLCGLVAFTGCQTDSSGVKSTYHTQWTTVAGDTTKVTNAAKEVLEELKLQSIESKSTAVDGFAHGMTADKTRVNVDVKRVSDNTSEVSVNVGALGDPSLGKDIISRIRKRTEG